MLRKTLLSLWHWNPSWFLQMFCSSFQNGEGWKRDESHSCYGHFYLKFIETFIYIYLCFCLIVFLERFNLSDPCRFLSVPVSRCWKDFLWLGSNLMERDLGIVSFFPLNYLYCTVIYPWGYLIVFGINNSNKIFSYSVTLPCWFSDCFVFFAFDHMFERLDIRE